MSAAEILAVIVCLALVVFGFFVAQLAVGEPCDHTPLPNIHDGKIFYACRCGRRFER